MKMNARTVVLLRDLPGSDGEVFAKGERMQVRGHWRGRLTLARYAGCAHTDRIRDVDPSHVAPWEPKVGERYRFLAGEADEEIGTIVEVRWRGQYGWHRFLADGETETHSVHDQELTDMEKGE